MKSCQQFPAWEAVLVRSKGSDSPCIPPPLAPYTWPDAPQSQYAPVKYDRSHKVMNGMANKWYRYSDWHILSEIAPPQCQVMLHFNGHLGRNNLIICANPSDPITLALRLPYLTLIWLWANYSYRLHCWWYTWFVHFLLSSPNLVPHTIQKPR